MSSERPITTTMSPRSRTRATRKTCRACSIGISSGRSESSSFSGAKSAASRPLPARAGRLRVARQRLRREQPSQQRAAAPGRRRRVERERLGREHGAEAGVPQRARKAPGSPAAPRRGRRARGSASGCRARRAQSASRRSRNHTPLRRSTTPPRASAPFARHFCARLSAHFASPSEVSSVRHHWTSTQPVIVDRITPRLTRVNREGAARPARRFGRSMAQRASGRFPPPRAAPSAGRRGARMEPERRREHGDPSVPTASRRCGVRLREPGHVAQHEHRRHLPPA